MSGVSNIEFDNSQNIGLEDYNCISDGIFPPPAKEKRQLLKNPKNATTTARFMG